MAQYVSRLGQRLEAIVHAAKNLRGKFAGAVGAYNALALLRPDDPEQVEAALMKKLGKKQTQNFSQIFSAVYRPMQATPQPHWLSCWQILEEKSVAMVRSVGFR